MARIGYARVSTIDQDLDTQLARLKAEGCGVIRSEKVSGENRAGRTELTTIIEFLRKRCFQATSLRATGGA
jgi:DNA invertase Pin-like site-specific DNA recombinase